MNNTTTPSPGNEALPPPHCLGHRHGPPHGKSNVGEYLAYVRYCLRHGYTVPAPETAEEATAMHHVYPDIIRRHSVGDCLALIEEAEAGPPPQPLPIEWMEQFLVSLNDSDFAREVRHRLEVSHV